MLIHNSRLQTNRIVSVSNKQVFFLYSDNNLASLDTEMRNNLFIIIRQIVAEILCFHKVIIILSKLVNKKVTKMEWCEKTSLTILLVESELSCRRNTIGNLCTRCAKGRNFFNHQTYLSKFYLVLSI